MTEDWRDNPVIVFIIDAVLLGLIRAHPVENAGDDGKRLRDAKKAIFGIKPPRGKPIDHDIPELLHMARLFVEDRGDFTFDDNYVPQWPSPDDGECRSKTELARTALEARKATDPNYKSHSEEKIRNLEQKFQASRDGLLRLVIGWGETAHDDIVGMHFRDFKETMILLGIPFDDLVAPSRDLNGPI